MNRITSSLFCSTLLITGIVFSVIFFSCKKNNFDINVNTKKIQEAAQIAPTTGQIVNYPIRDINQTLKIPIGFTNISGKDRVINLTYSPRSSTSILPQNGVHYKFPTSIVIPAGKFFDSLNLQAFYDQYPVGRSDTVKIKISGYPTIDAKDSAIVIIQRYCNVVLSQLSGEFGNTREFSPTTGNQTYGPYSTFVDNIVATGPTSAEGYFVNLYDEGWNDIKFIMDWSNPANFSITVPRQPTGKTGSDARVPKFVQSTLGKLNTFSSCFSTYTISLDLIGVKTDNADTLLQSGYQFRLAK